LISVPLTVYVVVEEGEAVTGDPVEELKPVEGVHEYVVAPPAVSVALC
jgi:translation elongation factor EF-1beta